MPNPSLITHHMGDFQQYRILWDTFEYHVNSLLDIFLTGQFAALTRIVFAVGSLLTKMTDVRYMY